MSLEIKGTFTSPDQQTSSSSNKKWGDVKEGPCHALPPKRAEKKKLAEFLV
jgi:hypothetical protein